jgi:hypothetical protein
MLGAAFGRGGTQMGATQSQSWTGLRERTLWDWLQLLIVPAVLSLGALWFSAAAEEHAQQTEEARARAAQRIEAERVMDGVLRSYLDEISVLLLDRSLLEGSPAVRNLARARTLTALGQLDGRRKGLLLGFLYEAGLIEGSPPSIRLGGAVVAEPVPGEVVLSQADLSRAKLSRIVLAKADLTRVNLAGADLRSSILRRTNLIGADLSNADLSGARLDEASLSAADLSAADLTGARLVGADLSRARGLSQAQLDGACGDARTRLPEGHRIAACPGSENGAERRAPEARRPSRSARRSR